MCAIALSVVMLQLGNVNGMRLREAIRYEEKEGQ